MLLFSHIFRLDDQIIKLMYIYKGDFVPYLVIIIVKPYVENIRVEKTFSCSLNNLWAIAQLLVKTTKHFYFFL